MSVTKTGTLHFRVGADFINNQARTFLREGEVDRAIDILKCLTENDTHVSQVLFGKSKFEEIGDTQRFKIVPDNTTEIDHFKIDANSVENFFKERIEHNRQIAKCFDIKLPIVTGKFSDDKDLNRVMLTYRNYKMSDRCMDEIFHPEWFIDYSVGNPMCKTTLIWGENSRRLRGEPNWFTNSKYNLTYLPTSRIVGSRYSLVKFFETLTDGFVIQTKVNLHTYDPKEVSDNYYADTLPKKYNKERALEKLLTGESIEDENSEEIEIVRKEETEDESKKKYFEELGRFADKVVQFNEKITYERKEGKYKGHFFFPPVREELLNIKDKYPELSEIVDKKIRILEMKDKPYDHDLKPDDLNMVDGLIDKDGNWYSIPAMVHERFASDYLKKLGKEKDNLSNKDELVKTYGWITVTLGMMDYYIIGGKYNNKQRKTLQRWMKKFKVKQFHPIGDMDFYGEVESEDDHWFDGGRE